jgi:hypothetical protein
MDEHAETFMREPPHALVVGQGRGGFPGGFRRRLGSLGCRHGVSFGVEAFYVPVFVILSEAKNLVLGKAEQRDSSLRSE